MLFYYWVARNFVGLATKWLRIFPLRAIDKVRNHLVAKPTKFRVPVTNVNFLFRVNRGGESFASAART